MYILYMYIQILKYVATHVTHAHACTYTCSVSCTVLVVEKNILPVVANPCFQAVIYITPVDIVLQLA